MDKPLCNICGARHRPGEAHKFAKSASDTPPLEPTRVHAPAPEVGRPVTVQPGEVCPTCGHRRAMTGADRQRRHRAKKQ